MHTTDLSNEKAIWGHYFKEQVGLTLYKNKKTQKTPEV